jgi:hypothetical protein
MKEEEKRDRRMVYLNFPFYSNWFLNPALHVRTFLLVPGLSVPCEV